MRIKNEKWLTEIFPGKEKIYDEYRSLPARELPIVACAVLDSALTELIFKKFCVNEKEAEIFLGMDGNGSAPAGSFGAKIQLALLLGIIKKNDAVLLRLMKDVRNLFAHRVKESFVSPNIVKIMHKMHAVWSDRVACLRGGNRSLSLDKIKPFLEDDPEAGAGLFLAIFTVMHAYFYLLSQGKDKSINDELRKYQDDWH